MALGLFALRRRDGGRLRLGGAVAVFGALACVFTAAVGVETLVERFGVVDPYAGRREFVESAVAMTVRVESWCE